MGEKLPKLFLRVHHLLPRTRVNGPGQRYLIHVQGCTLNCPGCFNPETHSQEGGWLISVEALLKDIQRVQGIEGVTLSGGEPLQQPEAVWHLLRALKEQTSLSVMLYSGYELSEIEQMALGREILQYVDILVDGRYNPSLRREEGLYGSANQLVHLLSDRYSREDLQPVGGFELHVNPDGTFFATGFPSPEVLKMLKRVGKEV